MTTLGDDATVPKTHFTSEVKWVGKGLIPNQMR